MSIPKPAHLGPQYAEQFKDRSVVEAYAFRAPYPQELFTLLTGLVRDEPRVVLDVGCGRGELARPLVSMVDRVDAVDFSAGMVEAGKRLPGGDNPRLNWICAPAETAPLDPPYALITAGQSIHWLDWDVALPRFAAVLAPGGRLALVYPRFEPTPWDEELMSIIPQFSTNRDYRPYDILVELEKRALFEKQGETQTSPVTLVQTVDSYIEAIHSMNGFSRERMTTEQSLAFDAEVHRLADPFARGGLITSRFSVKVTWGLPLAPRRDMTPGG